MGCGCLARCNIGLCSYETCNMNYIAQNHPFRHKFLSYRPCDSLPVSILTFDSRKNGGFARPNVTQDLSYYSSVI